MKDIKWTTGRIIDFEYFLRQDTISSDENYLRKRDRDIYLNHIQPEIDRGTILLMWLEAMKSVEIKAINIGDKINGFFSPGDMYEDLLYLLRTLFLIAGIVTGISLSLTFFSYTGSQPLNVTYFFALTLFPQICLLLILAASFSLSIFNLNKIRFVKRSGFLPYPLIGAVVENIFMAMNRRVIHNISSQRRDSLMSAIGIIKEGRQVYGLLFFWPVFIVMQLFGVAFNIGVLLSTLFRILFFDTAFGWQSTIQISPQIVAKIVEVVAAPWGWFLPAGAGFPDLDQIVGSRIILKDGIYHLTTNDLVSWWPFLCFAIIFYGLLPRLAMFASGLFVLKRSLGQQQFDHGACSNLIRRMVTADIAIKPLDTSPVRHLETEQLEAIKPVVEPKKNAVEAKQKEADSPLEAKLKPAILLMPSDIHHLIDVEKFKYLIQQSHDYEIKRVIEIGIDFDSEIDSVASEYSTIFDKKSQDVKFQGYKTEYKQEYKDEQWAVVIIQEAWQPPIRETLNFIKSIRNVVDKKTAIIVALTGKAEPENFFTPVEQSDWNIWKMKLATIGDPWLAMERVV